MFTSRVEFRLSLRPDNADKRLTRRGFKYGVVGDRRYRHYLNVQDKIQRAIAILKEISNTRERWSEILPSDTHISLMGSSNTRTAYDLLSLENMTFRKLVDLFPEKLTEFLDVGDGRVMPEAIYSRFAKSQTTRMEEIRKEGGMKLPENLDYSKGDFANYFSLECREKLNFYQPQTIAAASRIPGITPTALLHLMRFVKEQAAAQEAARN